MASPRPAAGASAPSTQPLTPPADAPSSTNQTSQPPNSNSPSNPAPTPSISNPTQIPATSLQDTGKSRRPRDARLIHMLLASQGVTAYQERVPLQLLDFAYRYTASTLSDAVYLVTEGYPGEAGPTTGGGRVAPGSSGGGAAAGAEVSNLSLGALRMSIASRLHYQFQPALPKEFLMDLASERNRMMLPGATRGGVDTGPAANAAPQGVVMGGMRLPPERFCLTGVGWELKDEWESDGEEDVELENQMQGVAAGGAGAGENHTGAEEEGGEDDDDGDGRMEDIFGDGELDGGGGQDDDKTMTDV
ncbi:hypothetical protein AJ80_00041 [Polytolypa hystricis UAMH7299]|uniref:Transcription initiation factor TFIID subunit 9 n=1 Tax=Polytolypa hystricis (strain UAMH7299) TaxID=1447883 RepID=A0A2B7Z468_POLH7|nr:hypothetical protein AJ80_00041 [Polytolypa hystricis UAMH7299]